MAWGQVLNGAIKPFLCGAMLLHRNVPNVLLAIPGTAA
jgi:hypothetical protein